VNYALLILLVCGSQADDTVLRANPNRPAYKDAVDRCREVERILAASPEEALEKLAPVFAEGIDKGRIKLFERRIYIEEKSLEIIPHDFYPVHLRGRARLLVARKKKDEEARRLLIDAVADLQTSLAKGAAQSKEPLAEALKDLWENTRAALATAGWKADRAERVDQAVAALAATDLARQASSWATEELGRVETKLRELRKEPPESEQRRSESRLAAEWCEALAAAFKGQPVAAAATRVGALAGAIRDSRGRFRLKIAVSPWATVTRLERDGEVIELADRDTPLVVPQELEIDNYRIELTSPKGRKDAKISAKSLEPGKTYVLWGDMSGGKFDVAELPTK
jgi:hypothetical protein